MASMQCQIPCNQVSHNARARCGEQSTGNKIKEVWKGWKEHKHEEHHSQTQTYHVGKPKSHESQVGYACTTTDGNAFNTKHHGLGVSLLNFGKTKMAEHKKKKDQKTKKTKKTKKHKDSDSSSSSSESCFCESEDEGEGDHKKKE